MILNSILEAVGNTPLIPLNKIGSKLKCNLYAKCEFLNPGGSVKDRIAVRMIEKAEEEGRIKPGDTLIEPTSGNTGIGMALAGAVKGYNIIITMPEKMSQEKQVVLESLGAKIIRTPTEAAWDDPDSHIEVAKRLQKQLPNAHILDQYSNINNPDAHYFGTGQEIIDDLPERLDMVVMGAGTGGTITGVAKKIKEKYPNCIVVGADPVGSILASDDDEVGTYKVEGIGYDFVPEVLNRGLIDRWVKTEDHQSFLLARELIKKEGLLCGGSSGSALYAALKEAAKLPEGANCVVVLPDGVRNYLTKFVSDKWMQDNRFTSRRQFSGNLKDIMSTWKNKDLTCVPWDAPASEAVHIMKENGFSQLPVTKDGKLAGMIFEKDLLEYMLSGPDLEIDTTVDKIMIPNIATVDETVPLGTLQDLLLSNGCVVVINKESKPLHILTKIDLVEWITKQEKQ